MWISKEKYEELMSRLDCTQKGLDFAREQTAQKQKELDAYKAEVEKQKREPVVMAQAQARDMIHRKLLDAEKTADPVELAKLTELWWKFWKDGGASDMLSKASKDLTRMLGAGHHNMYSASEFVRHQNPHGPGLVLQRLGIE